MLTMVATDKAPSTNPNFMQRESVRLPPARLLPVSSLARVWTLTTTEGLSTSFVNVVEKCCFQGKNLAIAECEKCLKLTLICDLMPCTMSEPHLSAFLVYEIFFPSRLHPPTCAIHAVSSAYDLLSLFHFCRGRDHNRIAARMMFIGP